MCPYYDMNPKKCAFFGTVQEQYQRDKYCLDKNDWRRCINYTNRSLSEKLNKKLRSNPDL